jgi:5-hydroxyisourate hydrolase-like protein (transthyretin family)
MTTPGRQVRRFAFAAAVLLSAGTSFGAVVSGVVRDESGILLEGMVVAAYTTAGTLQSTAKSDFSGRYTLDLPAGEYRILAYDLSGVFATTFAGNAESFESTAALALQASQTQQVDFVLVRGGTIVGAITTGGAPISNVVIAAYNISGSRRGFATTDGAGRYSLVLPPGEYKLVAFHNSGQYAPEFFAGRATFRDADRVTVAARTTQAVNFSLAIAATFAGTVRDTSGQPLPNMTVIAYTLAGAEAGSATTDANGRFAIALRGGTYRLVAVDLAGTYANTFLQDANSFESSPTVTLANGQFRGDLIFSAIRGGKVTGQVVDRTDGRPLGGITVAAYNLDGTQRAVGRTSPDGRYSLVLPTGSYKLVAYDEEGTYALQYYAQQVTFRGSTILSSGETNSANFDIEPASHIRGRVLDESSPVSGVTVGAYNEEGVIVLGVETDQNGRYDLPLPPGMYKLVVFDEQLRYVTTYGGGAQTFAAAPVRVLGRAQADTADFTVARGVRVSGTVNSIDGTPLTGVEIVALDGDGRRLAVTESTDGRFALALTPGRYFFFATDPTSRFAAEFYVNAITQRDAAPVAVSDASQSTLAFTLKPGTRQHGVRR